MSSSPDGALREAELGEVILYVSDLSVMKAFYTDVLGLSVVHENPTLAALTAAGGAQLVLHQGRPEGACNETHSFTQFIVKDIAARVAELSERGVDIGDVEKRPYGTYARFRDPEGNLVGLEEAR